MQAVILHFSFLKLSFINLPISDDDDVPNNELGSSDRINEDMITLNVEIDMKEKSSIISDELDDEAIKLLHILKGDLKESVNKDEVCFLTWIQTLSSSCII